MPIELLSRLLRHRRAVVLGALAAVMALLFVGGLMNVAWVGAIVLFVRLAKTRPSGDWTSRLSGLLLVIWARPTWSG